MQFGAKRSLEKTLGDLPITESLALSGAPAADVVILGCGREERRGGKRECDNELGLHAIKPTCDLGFSRDRQC
jgi:hypothetical protein